MANQEELSELKEQVVKGMASLLGDSSSSPEDRFKLSLQLAESNGEVEYYKAAYSAIDGMESTDDKMKAYMDLLGDIEFELQNIDSSLDIEYDDQSEGAEEDNQQQ